MTIHSFPTRTTGAFVVALERSRKELTAFEACPDGVLMHIGGRTSLLTMKQVSDLMDTYEREERAAEAEASLCRRRFNQLWDARCLVVDRDGGPPKDAA